MTNWILKKLDSLGYQGRFHCVIFENLDDFTVFRTKYFRKTAVMEKRVSAIQTHIIHIRRASLWSQIISSPVQVDEF